MFRFVSSVVLGGLSAGCVLQQGSGVLVTEELDLEPYTELRLATQIDLQVDDGQAVSGTFTCDDNLIDNVTFDVSDDGVLTVGTKVLDRGFRPSGECGAALVSVGLERVEGDGSGELTLGDQPALRVARAAGSGDVVVAGMGEQDVLIESLGSGGVDVTDASRARTLLVKAEGSGNVDVARIDADRVNVDITGSGDITLSGVTEELDLRITSSGSLDAENLEATRAEVDLGGSGDATIHVTNVVTGDLRSSGDLTVKGDARVDVEVSGSGRVR